MESISNWKESLNSCLVFHSRDWSTNKRDAWLYGIIVGWDDECLTELQELHGWTNEAVDRLKMIRKQYVNADNPSLT